MKRIPILSILITVLVMTSCGTRKNAGENPFFTEWNTPFGVPPFDEIKAEHYKPAFLRAMELHKAEIDSIVNNTAAPTFDNVILALDESGDMLVTVSLIFSNIMGAESTDELRAIENEISPLLTAHGDDILMNEGLFARIKAVYDNRTGLDSLRLRLTEKTYRDFVRAGANLSPQDKERLREINTELTLAQIKFGNNVLAATNNFVMLLDTADVAGLPQELRTAAAEKASGRGETGKFAFTLSKPSMLPFLTYSGRRDLREKLYRGYLERANYGDPTDNRDLVNSIVSLRTERAKLLGFNHHAAYQLDERMAKNTEAVYDLLDALWTPSLESAKRELEDMREIRKSEGGGDDFESWDWWYYAEKVRRKKYDLDEEMLKPYMSLDNVRSGIFELSNRLYGLTFRPVNIPVFHKECVSFEVLDRNNTHLGILIMDFHPREGKQVGAWCEALRSRTYRNGVRTADPIVVIVCNFTAPSGNQPALLSLDEVETFFHEFGHALHFLFIDVPYRGLQETEQDFVELPSQIMENWAFEPAVLRMYATHYRTKAVIPDNLIDKLGRSMFFNQGFITTEYLAASLSDMDIHSIPDFKPVDVNGFETEILNVKRGLIPQIAPRYRFPYFNHIFAGSGYSAGYYGYIWAEVLDKDAYEAFAETGDIFNRTVADSFLKNILSKGGSADGMVLYRNFRGAYPSREYLLYARGLRERPARVKVDDIVIQPAEAKNTTVVPE